MSLDEALDTLHQERRISVQKLLDETVLVLDEVVETLLDTGQSLDIVTRVQMLKYLLAHVVIEGPKNE